MTALIPDRVLERLWDRVDSTGGSDACWPWRLSRGSHGYGQVGWYADGRTWGTTAMRAAWVAAVGPIPDGMTVDHLCRNRVCCNPAHLRLLSNRENAKDNGMARRTHCPHGHPYNETNTYIRPNGHRDCRACARLRRGS